MYTTCIFCHAALGANDVIEHFPVGRRLAFDAERGRLWVVCPRCERWNLSPFETRWEAIEEAERLYRDTRRRVATDNIASGGRTQSIADAVRIVEDAGSMPALLRTASVADPLPSWVTIARTGESMPRGALSTYKAPIRLALEMALHEDDERRAMAGELGVLYARWEEAERVARIADGDLTSLPD